MIASTAMHQNEEDDQEEWYSSATYSSTEQSFMTTCNHLKGALIVPGAFKLYRNS